MNDDDRTFDIFSLFHNHKHRHSWDELKTHLTQSLLNELRLVFQKCLHEGLASVDAMVSAENEHSIYRYREWLARSYCHLTTTINHAPRILDLFGGPLAGERPLQLRVEALFDLLLASYLTKVMDVQMKDVAIVGGMRSRGVARRIRELVQHDTGQILDKVDALILSTNRTALDYGVYFALRAFLDERYNWLVVIQVPELDYDGNGTNRSESLGQILGFELLRIEEGESAGEVSSLWESIEQSEHWRKRGFNMPESFETFARHAAGRFLLHGVLYAHSAAIVGKIESQVTACSGICGIPRSWLDAPWSFSDPHGAEAWAFRIDNDDPPFFESGFPGDFSNRRGPFAFQIYLPFEEAEWSRLWSWHSGFDATVMDVLSTAEYLPGGDPRLSRAFRYWSNAEMKSGSVCNGPNELAEAYMSYCTVAEVLFGAGSDVVETVASRMAGVVADDATERAQVRKRIRKLYKSRSKFVHEAEVVMNLGELNELREFIRRSIEYAIRYAVFAFPRSLLENIDEVAAWNRLEDAEEGLRQMRPFDGFQDHCDSLRFGGKRVPRMQAGDIP